MSLGYPTVRPSPGSSHAAAVNNQSEYGITSSLNAGLNSTKKDEAKNPVHPLQYSEEHWMKNLDQMHFVSARNMQGLHMPMKLGMENFAASQVGRLPCMATRTSNLMMDTLTGNDEFISVEDVFCNPMENPERMGNVHALMEKKMGIF